MTRTLAEVRSDVRLRFLRDERQLESRQLAGRLLQRWRRGRRDAALEARLGVRTSPPVVLGCRVDTGLVAQALSDTIWKMPAPRGGALFAWSRGCIVWEAMTRLDRVTSSYFQAQDMLATGLRARQEAAELDGARAFYVADPGRFRRADVIHFTRLHFLPLTTLLVPLSRAEVEKWYRDHIDHYSAPEMVSARHILVSPANASAAADQAALAKAREILRRLQAGEDFTSLARAYSEDPATRDIGGELGPSRAARCSTRSRRSCSAAVGDALPRGREDGTGLSRRRGHRAPATRGAAAEPRLRRGLGRCGGRQGQPDGRSRADSLCTG